MFFEPVKGVVVVEIPGSDIISLKGISVPFQTPYDSWKSEPGEARSELLD